MSNPTTQLIESGSSDGISSKGYGMSQVFTYEIKVHLKGEKAQYYTLRGTQGEKNGFLPLFS